MDAEESENKYSNLEELGGSGFEIADGQPDVRGWDVIDGEGLKIGEVEEVLFNRESQKVRYLVVDIDDNELNLTHTETAEKHPGIVLIPIGLAELDEDEDEILVPDVTAEQIAALPPYEKGNVTPVTESITRSVLAGTAVGDAIAYNAENFYSHEHFDEQRFYGNRRVSGDTSEIAVEGSLDDENLPIGYDAEHREIPPTGDFVTIPPNYPAGTTDSVPRETDSDHTRRWDEKENDEDPDFRRDA